jgi:uncharacterized protein (UPF0305 family)
MSFKNNYALYTKCQTENIKHPLTVPFINSIPIKKIDNNYISNVNNYISNENNYIFNEKNKTHEQFINKNQIKPKEQVNDFPLAWTCIKNKDGSYYCPLRGDIAN